MRIAGFDAGDLVGGALVTAGGVAFMLGAATYPIGTLHRMGPGYLPLVTGAILTGIGVLLIVASRTTTSTLPQVSFRPLFAIFAGLVWFALTLERFGVGPSTVGLVVLVSLGQEKPNWIMVAATAAFLVVMSIGIFIYVLNLPLKAFAY
jgi:putative tricarboxylic transport membrane protein